MDFHFQQELLARIDGLMVPATLEDAFDAYRFDLLAIVCKPLGVDVLSRYLKDLNMLNPTLEPRSSFGEIFDPFLMTATSAAQLEAGTTIELPPLPIMVASRAPRAPSRFLSLISQQIERSRTIFHEHTDRELEDLFLIGSAALVDEHGLKGRIAISAYLAVNSSLTVREFLRKNEAFWRDVPRRRVSFPDMVAARTRELNEHDDIFTPPLSATELTCWTDEQIRMASADSRLYAMQPVRHLVFCARCLRRLQKWQELETQFRSAEFVHQA